MARGFCASESLVVVSAMASGSDTRSFSSTE